jgi:hypothetical protein
LQIFVIKFGWKRTIGQSILRPFNNNKWIHTFSYGKFENFWKLFSKKAWGFPRSLTKKIVIFGDLNDIEGD